MLPMQAQVYVFCCAHAEQVKQHLQDAEWTKEGASMDVQVAFVSTLVTYRGEF